MTPDCAHDPRGHAHDQNPLEAFTDAVIAIILSIMVLELKVPHDVSWHALARLYPAFLSYVLSCVFLGIYWYNHHQISTACHAAAIPLAFVNGWSSAALYVFVAGLWLIPDRRIEKILTGRD